MRLAGYYDRVALCQFRWGTTSTDQTPPLQPLTQSTFIEKWPHFLCRSKVLVQTDTTRAAPSSLVCYQHGMERREQQRTENRTSSDVSLVTVKLDIDAHAVIPAFSKLREKNYHSLEVSLGYAEKPCPK